MSFLNSVHQRLNQMNSEVGWPALIDTEHHDQHAEKLANVALARLGPLDDHHDAQGIAMKTVHRYRDSLKAERDGVLGDRANIVGDPDAGLYILLAYEPTHLIALDDPANWEATAKRYLPRFYRSCDIEVTRGCTPTDAPIILPIKTGEFVCVFQCCQRCREWFDEPLEMRENLERSDSGTWWDEADRR